jgi:hypothetical protein
MGTRSQRRRSLPCDRAQRLQVDAGLKRALVMLLAKDGSDAISPEACRKQKRDQISQRRRERGRPVACAVLVLGTEEFDKVGALERDLVQRYYGIGEERPWTRGELARTFGLSTGRVEDLVNIAVRALTGMEVTPAFDRTCTVCGVSFTLRSRVSRRRTCDSGCESELKRAGGRASARARARRTDAPLPWAWTVAAEVQIAGG